MELGYCIEFLMMSGLCSLIFFSKIVSSQSDFANLSKTSTMQDYSGMSRPSHLRLGIQVVLSLWPAQCG